jgi:hypothetical protein
LEEPGSKRKEEGEKMKLKFSPFSIGVLAFICHLCFGICHLALAQDNEKLVSLSKQIIEAKNNEELYAPFEQLKDLYFKDNRYTEFLDFLKSLAAKKNTIEPFINYYIALTRYSQLKHLEEKQIWDEYFSQGNTYRDELTQAAQKAIDTTGPKDTINIYSRLILWQFHKDQQDVFAEDALNNLMNSVTEYLKLNSDLKPVKEIADKLSSYGEKGKSKELYKAYAQKLISSNMTDEALSSAALVFYKEGNLELSKSIYDVYVDRIAKSLPKEKSIPLLIDIAKAFSYKEQGAYDLQYAQELFNLIEQIGGKESLNQELMYLRAFNLEKAKEYSGAKSAYIDLIQRFPADSHADEAIFKIGMINTHILRDVKQGKAYFEQLASRVGQLSPQVISSLYQLGLLSQWESDYTHAKDYYNKLITLAGNNFSDTVTLARDRLKEIEEGKPLEYNLLTFLDVSLKEENKAFDMTKINLVAMPYRPKKDENTSINSTVYAGQSGCMQVELQYLWSGNTGTNKPWANQPAFNTTYALLGTKEINLVVVSPSGIIDRSLDMLDVN